MPQIVGGAIFGFLIGFYFAASYSDGAMRVIHAVGIPLLGH